MDDDEFARQVAGVAALAEPVRRDLYRFVVAQGDPVTRDQAAEAVGVARHTVKFHLDRLVDEGLLDVDFKRLSGREGPGAGRPTKRYRRSAREVAVSLPERHYDLAGLLMARAIDESAQRGGDVVTSLHHAAAEHGGTVGAQVAARLPARVSRDRRVLEACAALSGYGYEPHVSGRSIELANCPFHALAQEHTELVCGMNLALLDAVADALDDGALTARLDPAPGRCCVVLDLA